SSEGLLFDVCNEPFSTAIWKPMAAMLDRLGVEVCFGHRVASLDELSCDGVVLAVDAAALRALRPDLATNIVSAPPFAVWRLWLDRPTRPDRESFIGTAGLGILDNVSCLHAYQGEARRWAARTGGAVVELHAYALPGGMDDDDVKTELLAR